MYFGQTEPIKVQVLRFSSVGSTFFKFLMSFFNAQVSSKSSFAFFFSVTIHNSSVVFCVKHYILLTKVAHQTANFQTCHCSHWNSLNSPNSPNFLQILHHSSVSRDITLLYFFIYNFICFGQKEPIKVPSKLMSACTLQLYRWP